MAPLVQIASVLLVVGAIYNAAMEAGTQAAAEAVKSGASSEVASAAASEAIKSSITTAVYDSITSSFLGTSASSILAGNLTTMQMVSVANRAVAAYTEMQRSKLKSISNKNNDLKAEYDKLAEESSRESAAASSAFHSPRHVSHSSLHAGRPQPG